MQKSQNLFVDWEELGSSCLRPTLRKSQFKSMEELGKFMFTLESKIGNFHEIRLFTFET